MRLEEHDWREALESAIYTDERKLWLDPDDLQSIITDIVTMIDEYGGVR